MTPKQIAAYSAAAVALVGAVASGLAGQVTAADVSTRVRALEVREEEHGKRLERIEQKLDRLILDRSLR